ncbi:hypothetical protein GCM10028795_06900 [Lysobacter olei]
MNTGTTTESWGLVVIGLWSEGLRGRLRGQLSAKTVTVGQLWRVVSEAPALTIEAWRLEAPSVRPVAVDQNER